MNLLRKHAGVFPKTSAQPLYLFGGNRALDPVSHEVLDDSYDMKVHFDWEAAHFLADKGDGLGSPVQLGSDEELLMLALPHHRDIMQAYAESTNQIYMEAGACTPTLHGEACGVVGNVWEMVESLANVSFYAKRGLDPDMVPDLEAALEEDLKYDVEPNYRRGAGDTYFSGKMLAKLARIILISDQVNNPKFVSLRKAAIDRLASGTEIWLNGKGQNPFIYDDQWGGLASCGCTFNDAGQNCSNTFPECPALDDMGNNFGFSFFNDHHFHLGYHIYAAAALGAFDSEWLIEHWEHILLYVRDIANPSRHDPFFPPNRHKDWYLGSSWASGVVTINKQPFPNGRNEESSSEAIAAYEAVALLGSVALRAFDTSAMVASDNPELKKSLDEKYAVAAQIYDFGRLLLSTEIRSATRYWHVTKDPKTRVYPAVYKPKAVGMLWSTLAQFQTWFGPEDWKTYGIQMMPFTPAAEKRDDPMWVHEMLPEFADSCTKDPICEQQGWSVLVYLSMATIGDKAGALKGIQGLADEVFTTAGGNGHSRTNSLWWIATRPPWSAPAPPPPSAVPVVAAALAGIALLSGGWMFYKSGYWALGWGAVGC
mmetsp:Transcript_23094/g.52084  ORF Transcript_23094/g.52084 Transcript_23094/m.52084 type:complete len:596 (-) Transcript_23094:68-1855(-)